MFSSVGWEDVLVTSIIYQLVNCVEGGANGSLDIFHPLRNPRIALSWINVYHPELGVLAYRQQVSYTYAVTSNKLLVFEKVLFHHLLALLQSNFQVFYSLWIGLSPKKTGAKILQCGKSIYTHNQQWSLYL